MINLDATVDTSEEILQLSDSFAPKLNFELKEIENWELLYTIAGVESSFGANNVCRFEEAYSRRGKFFKARHLQRAHTLYGDLAAMSYGPWQIMYIKAQELGFQGNPLDLWYGRISIKWVVKYLNEAHERGAKTVDEFCDAYNSGSHRDSFVPHSYLEKFWYLYETQTKKSNYKEGNRMENEKKKPWLSKTLWANLLIAIVAFIPWEPLQAYIASNPEIVMQVIAGVNVALRLITNSKVSLK